MIFSFSVYYHNSISPLFFSPAGARKGPAPHWADPSFSLSFSYLPIYSAFSARDYTTESAVILASYAHDEAIRSIISSVVLTLGYITYPSSLASG